MIMEPVLKSAFRRGDHAEVVRLLPLLTQHKIFHCFQSGTLDFSVSFVFKEWLVRRDERSYHRCIRPSL